LRADVAAEVRLLKNPFVRATPPTSRIRYRGSLISRRISNPSNEVAIPKPKKLKGKRILNFTETSKKTYFAFENASIISEMVLSMGLSRSGNGA